MTVHLHVDEEGVVQESRMFESAGYEGTLNRDHRVAVRVAPAITSTVR